MASFGDASSPKACLRAPASGLNAEVDRVNEAEWNSMLLRFEDASVYQTWSYEAVRWGEGRASRIVLKHGRQVVAAAQVRVLKPPLLRCGVAYVYRGPLWRLKDEPADPQRLRDVLAALHDEYVVKRGLLLRLVPSEVAGEPGDATEIFLSAGFRRPGDDTPDRTFVLDLSPPLDVIRKQLRHQWRTNLNKACARPFEVVEGDSDELYAEFLPLYREMHARKGFRQFVDVDEFREVQRRLPGPLKMRVMLCRYEGEAVSGMVFSTLGGTALNIFMATNRQGLEVQGAYRLLWEQIQWFQERGIRRVDLGGIDPAGNPGGYRFKQGLSGRDTCFIGRFEACDNLWSRVAVGAAQRFRKWHRRQDAHRAETNEAQV